VHVSGGFAVHTKLLPAAPTAGVTPLTPHVLVPEAVYPELQVGVHDTAEEPPPTVLVQSPTAPLVGTALKSQVVLAHVPPVSEPPVHLTALQVLPALGVPQVHVAPPFSVPPTVQVPPVNVIPAGVVGLASTVVQSFSHLTSVTVPARHDLVVPTLV